MVTGQQYFRVRHAIYQVKSDRCILKGLLKNPYITHICDVLQLRSRGSHGVIGLRPLDILQRWTTIRRCIGAGHMPLMSLLIVVLNPTLEESERARWKQMVGKQRVQILTSQTGVDKFSAMALCQCIVDFIGFRPPLLPSATLCQSVCVQSQ
jgi:hypothetical protein